MLGSTVKSIAKAELIKGTAIFFIFNLFFNFILKITHPDIYLQI